MRRWIMSLAALALLAAFSFASAQNRQEGQGALWSIGPGGALNIESGGALKFAGVDQTSALATAPAAVAAGYKIARGETALDGSNPTPVTTGLSTIVACALSIKATAAPGSGDGTRIITYDTSTGTMNMYAWAPTSGTDPTLVASTGTETVGWVCVGT